MNKLELILTEYGANYNEIMQRFMGNEGLYIRVLGMLFADDNMEKLQDAIASSDYRGAFEAGHTLKGVSANLGLTPFYNSICLIVEPLRTEDKSVNYDAMFENILAEYHKVEEVYKNLQQ